MARKIDVTYYKSDIIKNVWFTTESDADHYDEVLTNYVKNHKKDWIQAESVYPSHYAVYCAILRNDFQFNLDEKSENLILAIENSIDQDYSQTFLYLLHQFHPKIKYNR